MFQLDLKSRKSIYEQIVDGCKEMIICGDLEPNEKLPSVREMSALLTVNPNTIQKAYSRLEQDGWIYTVTGRGAFVSEELHEPDTRQIESIFEQIGALMGQLRYLGVKGEEMIERLKKISEERGTAR
ncbi:MAG: GntR family transcriptional regulator [Firmicutes bacterium]|nr:GntR family transcriptional regulator [Bacillota bacterium]MBQ3578352.1 GntR family transcriptional regulator [Bacillota bacterium]MBQ5436901.1 GntR family transcriptional regulator [Bacillota bacterium]MBQ6013207.1 GntR family transcriptional regulator [Bacillota bacterium]MBR0441088.1 GntR family transcriptional regulator [Bacillota bacterium]